MDPEHNIMDHFGLQCFSVSVVFLLAGRQVKMAFVNSVAKPPRDVRRRQEKFGTSDGSSTASTAAAAPIKSVSHPGFYCIQDYDIISL